jgi:hypothetical protein
MYRIYVDEKQVATFASRQDALDEADVRWAMGEGRTIEVFRQTKPGHWVLIEKKQEGN